MKIYFAGPNVFHPEVEKIDDISRKISKEFSHTPLIPTDTEIRPEGTPAEIAQDIFEANVEHIKNCDVILANITPFRGACVDDGTSWEIGMAYALGKKVYTYSFGNQDTKSIIVKNCGLKDEKASPLRDLEGHMIEDFGLQANLMIACATEKHFASEGNITTHYEPLLRQILQQISTPQ